jgi:uncharacterized protein Yka (UPF0111/DUF47 family)
MARPANQPTLTCSPFSDEEEIEEMPETVEDVSDTRVRRAGKLESYIVKISDVEENADQV